MIHNTNISHALSTAHISMWFALNNKKKLKQILQKNNQFFRACASTCNYPWHKTDDSMSDGSNTEIIKSNTALPVVLTPPPPLW